MGMYFDLAPKERKEDFFDYTYEYDELDNAIKRKDRIVVLIGVRRVGKTSLMNVLYHRIKNPKIWIDGRIIENPKRDIPNAIVEMVESGVSKIIGNISGFNVAAFGFGVGLSAGKTPDYKDLKKKIGKKQLYVFIDEAQRMDPLALADLLSYFYDQFPQITFILSGSEVGLLEEIIGSEKTNHPLHGRNIVRINMVRMDPGRSVEFLRKGFRQIKIEVSEEDLADAIKELDGLIGWLTLYGYRKGVMKSKDAMKETIEIASKVAASELSSFLRNRKSKRIYLSILRHATGISWSELKARVEKDIGKTLNPNLLSFTVNELMKYSFLEKYGDGYHLPDPLLLRASFLV